MPNRRAAVSARPSLEALEDRCVPASAAGGFADFELVSTNATPAQPGIGLGTQAAGTPANAAGLDTLRTQYPGLTGAGYTVAVIDSGIDYLHPALGGGFGAGKKVVNGRNFVVNGNGFVSTKTTWDPMDENGHGTNVAGIIAAKDAIYSGVAPDANLVALRVLDSNGQGTWEWVEQALQWVIDNRAAVRVDAINLSLGSGNYSGFTSDFLAIDAKLQTLYTLGVVNVASGGNDYFKNSSVQGLQYPAASNWTLAVAAVYDGNYGSRSWGSGAKDFATYKDKIASFTQRSPGIELLAPGALITSTGLSSGGTANYWTYAGSSQAAPFVTGAAILVKQAYASQGQAALATANVVRDILRASGDTIVDGAPAAEDNVLHTGLSFPRLNVRKALELVGSLHVPGSAADQYEANNTQAAARFVGTLGGNNAFAANYHSFTDIDWYTFTAANTGSFRMEVAGSAGATLGFMAAGATAETAGAATATGASLTANLVAGTRYYVRTSGKNTGSYALSINGPTIAAPVALLPDRYEANETIAAAKNLGGFGAGTATGLTLSSPADLDWFRFQSSVAGTRRIRVVSETAGGAAAFTFRDIITGRERTLNSTFVNGVATLDVDLRTNVNYFLGVRSSTGTALAYRIEFGAPTGATPIVPPAGVRTTDAYESNEAIAAAKNLGAAGASTFSSLAISTPADQDWFRFQTTVQGRRRIQVVSETEAGAATFTFRDITTGKERTLNATFVNGVATLDVDLRTGVNYFLGVRSAAGKTTNYRIAFAAA